MKKRPKGEKRERGGERTDINPPFLTHFSVFRSPFLTVHLMTRANDRGAGNSCMSMALIT